MKSPKLKLPCATAFLKVYRHSFFYTKEDNNHDHRSSRAQWHTFNADKCFVEDQSLFLSEKILSDARINGTKAVVVVVDNVNSDYIAGFTKEPVIFCKNKSKILLDFFEVKINDLTSLSFIYDQSTIGVPMRDCFSLGALKPSKAIEFQINGKIDFSLTSRRERSYVQHQYIWHFMGVFDEYNVIKSTINEDVNKLLPSRKLIDMKAVLW